MCKIFKNALVCFMVVLAMTFLLPGSIGSIDVHAKSNVKLNYSWITITQGYKMKLKVLGTSKKVKWSSSNKKIATVNKKGKVTGRKKGKCTVTAKMGRKKYKCKVKVKKGSGIINSIKPKKPFEKITLNVSSVKINLKDVKYSPSGTSTKTDSAGKFKLKVFNTDLQPEWKTSNENIATVENGLITAVSAGNCTVSAVIKGKSYKCSVVITDMEDDNQIQTQKNIYEVLDYVNKKRILKKVAPLKIKEELNNAAAIRAKEAGKKFSHTRPDGSKYTTAIKDSGIKKWARIGENLAYTEDKAEYLPEFIKRSFSNLYKSKQHRENMLNVEYLYIGIGYYSSTFRDKNGYLCVNTYWAQEFYR